MANGLRKLIRNARKLSTPSPLTRRFNRFGPRLNVEELEERIAPATVSLEPGEYSIYDLDANNTPGVGDGWIGLSDATTAGVTASFEATETGGIDTIDTSLTINLGSVAGACVVHVATNRSFEDVTITGGASVTTLTIAIETGYDTTFLTATDDFSIDSSDAAVTGDCDTLNTDELTGDPTGGADLAFTNVAAANAAMGAITFPSHAGLLVEFHIQAGLTGDLATFGGIVSTDADIDFQGDESNGAASTIAADTIAVLGIAGLVAPGAQSITIDADAAISDIQIALIAPSGAGSVAITAGSSIGDILMGGIAPAAAGGVTITATTTIGDMTLGTVAPSGAGNVAITSGGDVGDLTFTAINLTGAGNFTINSGGDVGDVDVTNDISTTSTGDVMIDATAADGVMGDVTVGGSVTTGNAGSTITLQASDGMGDVTVTGSVGGSAGTVTFDGNDDAADDGDVGNVDVGANLGNSGAAVVITGVNIGTIDAQKIGLGAGGVTITADDPDNDNGGAANGVIGALGTGTTIVSIGEGGVVTFNADDGIGGGTAITVAGSIAFGGAVTFDANRDNRDDDGAVPAITAGTTIGTTGANTLIIDTNNGTIDTNVNAASRTVGAITANDGFARVNITSDGNVGMVTVQGDNAGNDLEIVLDTTVNSGATITPIDFAGINVPDTANDDSVTFTAASSVTGRIWSAGANGQIIAGGGDATDVLDLDADLTIYNGNDSDDGVIDADYSATNPFQVMFTTGDVTGAGTIIAATRTASPLFTAVIDGETFTVDVTNNDSSAVTMTATLTFDPAAGPGGDDLITIDDIDGTGIGDTTELSVTSSEGTEFDCGGITLATGGEGTDLALISIEGDLGGNIGEIGEQFGDVEVILIAGSAGGNTFYGTGLNGLGTGEASTLNLGPNVDIHALDRDTDEPLVIPGELTFNFADTAGATAGSFNHHITVAGAGSSITVYGIDGTGNGDGGVTTAYEFSGVGQSSAAIDPSGLMTAVPDALISRINLDGITGLSTDVAVREVEGTTSGSWLEFETNVGLVELTTQLDSISVGIDDNSDAVDNVVVTGINQQADTRANFDRLGGGEGGSAKRGLEPATSVSDDDAIMGNFIVASMGDPGAANINVVVTGNCGPITLTGDFTLETSDIGSLDADNGAGAAAIAIGGNQVGAITIPGAVDGDILIGIGLDANGDTDLEDVDDVAPSGSLSGLVTIGNMDGYDILVYDDITSSILITGYDNEPETPGLDDDGDIRGIKTGGDLGDLAEDVVMVHASIQYVIADGALNSGIFSGGGVTETVVIEGTTINGPGVIGGSEGVLSVNFIDHEVFGDVGDWDVIVVNAGGMTVQWTAGAFGNTVDTLGDVYLIGGNATLTVNNVTGDGLNIGDMFLLNDGSLNINSDNNVGVAVAADDVTVPTSEALQDLISATYDVVYSPTGLDNASGDDADMLSYSGTIETANAGGVIAEDDVTVTADIAGTFGYIVALNGSVDTCDVHAGLAIGSIVASTNIIDNEFRSEGTLAVGAPTALAADLTAWGLTGVPSWFLNAEGGVLTQNGDIDSSDFIATGDAVETQGHMTFAATVMGTFYVVVGDFDSDSNVLCGGSMGGIQVPTGIADMFIQVSMDGNIDRIIVANWSPAANSQFNTNRVGLFVDASDGDMLVVASNPLETDALNISVTGADTLVVVMSTNDVLVVGGLEAGSSVDIEGNVDELTIDGNWAGAVTVGYHPIADTLGIINTIIVADGIAATATLGCFNFYAIQVDESQVSAAVMDTFTLTRTDPVETFTGLNGTQTLALDGAGVTAYVTTMFGKPIEIELMGFGLASLYSLEGTATIAEARSVGVYVTLGRADLDTTDDATAHVGAVTVGGGSRVMLRNVVVEGESDYVSAGGNMLMNFYNAGDAGDVQANMIMRAFIGGHVEWLTARMLMNTQVNGGADAIGAWLFNQVSVSGTTEMLFATGGFEGNIWNGNLNGAANGMIINSYFEYVDDNNFDYDWDEDGIQDEYNILDDFVNPVRIINSYIGMYDEGNEE